MTFYVFNLYLLIYFLLFFTPKFDCMDAILIYDGSHLVVCFMSRCDLISMLVQIEGPALLNGGFNAAVAKVGLQKFVSDLFWVGMFYHLYNQVWI